MYKEHILFCRCYGDIQEAIQQGKAAALLSLENGLALQGELSSLRIFYKLGVRSVCLTWNGKNEIADGVKSTSDDGLTLFGRSLVREMNSLGMVVDVSHISKNGFWDVLSESKSPIIASHSNAISICSNIRNLDDEQISAIHKSGGVIGINLYPYFLTNTNKAALSDVIKHIEHIATVGGIDCIGLGTDFDGIECTPSDLRGVEELYRIFEELYRLNYSENDIEKIAGQNFLRVLKIILK
jgi:membrane dipeptidase